MPCCSCQQPNEDFKLMNLERRFFKKVMLPFVLAASHTLSVKLDRSHAKTMQEVLVIEKKKDKPESQL